MARCYQLIGIPGSGKTTWAKSQDWIQECAYVSTDIWVEIEADRQGKTYSEVFEDYMPKAVNIMSAQVVDARDQERDIVWDQTSTTITSRMRKFNMLPNYEHIAVVFRCPDVDELMRRLNSRPGKIIPLGVIEGMVHNFEVPSEEEGFKEIWFVN
jgi:adenylate kinase family enzyme